MRPFFAGGGKIMLAGLVLLASQGLTTVCAAERTWIRSAATTGDWFDASNWSSTQAPTNDGDTATITNGYVLLTSNTAALAGFTLTNAVMVFSNWTTKLTASNVGVWSGGTVTVANAFTTSQMSNRVWIVCANFTLATGGVINVDARGYAGQTAALGPGYGPGAGAYVAGGGYGGKGGYTGGGNPYGSTNAPIAPGSGGGGSGGHQAGAGGGAVRIDASGDVTIHGLITANGGATVAGVGGGGSGGGIFIGCQGACSGSASAVLRANGGNNPDAAYGSGGGGRIGIALLPGAALDKLIADGSLAWISSYATHDLFLGALSVTNGISGAGSGNNGQPGTAWFCKTNSQCVLTVSGTPANYGSPTPVPYGSTTNFEFNDWVTNTVASPVDQANGLRHACWGWELLMFA